MSRKPPGLLLDPPISLLGDKPTGRIEGGALHGAPVFGVPPKLPPPSRVAELDEWITACAEAHLRLCVGAAATVYSDSETWEQAIVRVAAALITAHGLGRPKGKLPAEWVAVVHHVADRPSSATDGMVSCGRLRLPLSSLHRTRKDPSS